MFYFSRLRCQQPVAAASSGRRIAVDDAAPSGATASASRSGSSSGIFRRDMAESGAKGFPLSVDIASKKLVDCFNDYESKRCKLCNETYLQWHSHTNASIPHVARESLMLELVRAHCGTPQQIQTMWWNRLHNSPKFRRIPSLSHDESFQRKRRLLNILTFLRDKRVLRECFDVTFSGPSSSAMRVDGPITSASRSFEFERLEWVGDNVVKYLFNNRINCLFPYAEGGIRGRLGYVQFMIDGNEGLARAYDFLELQKLTRSNHVVSKFKSDVVETMFGEMQLYLWSTEHDLGTEQTPMPFTPGSIPLRELVFHAMEEAAHCMIMYHIDTIVQNLLRVTAQHNVSFPRADPMLAASTPAAASNSLTSPSRRQQFRGGHALMSTRSQHPCSNGRELFFLSTNYDAFAQVVRLGGLLPRPFRAEQLVPVPTFLPHLQTKPLASSALSTSQPTKDIVFKSLTEELRSPSNIPSDSLLPDFSVSSDSGNRPNSGGGSRPSGVAVWTLAQLKHEGLVNAVASASC